MNTKMSPKELATGILTRSTCAVQVGAVAEDAFGVFAWGWNSAGPDGMGMHAEHHLKSRANKWRIPLATLYVSSRRKKNKKPVSAKPCKECQKRIAEFRHVCYRDANGDWKWLW